MKRIVIALWSGLLFFVLTSSAIWAQATAQISGAVRDSSGAVLPGVEITATQTETGVPRMTVTNETGAYVLSNLAVGPYRLEAALPGFRTFVQASSRRLPFRRAYSQARPACHSCSAVAAQLVVYHQHQLVARGEIPAPPCPEQRAEV